MRVELATSDLERFRAAIASRLGLYFDEGKSGFLEEVLRRRIEATGRDAHAYLSGLEMKPAGEELGALGRELTVAETYFFRNVEQYRALTDVVVPERLAARAAERCLRVLSLGCASGEEAYSLAMLVRDTLADVSWHVSVIGVDVNAVMIEKARRGRFSAWALRETPEGDRQRWFRRDGREFVLDDAIRASVRFEQRNLAEEDPTFWKCGEYDVVFCRNVIMYFAPEQAQRLIGRIAHTLCPGGYLFLGHAETLRGLSSDFHLCHTHGTFYYKRKAYAECAAPMSRRYSEAIAGSVASLSDAAASSDSWVDAIRRASERVAALTASRPVERAGDTSPAAVTPVWDRGLVLELLRKERFADALALVDALPSESGRDADVLLLRSVLLVHGGQLPDAEIACRRLLEVDELSAGAHYLLALCREGAGDRAASLYHDQVAVYLDPGFAMPRLHVGLLARRAGERGTARRELGHALVLLQREDTSRILLFGGGFNREALMALCRTELLRCGGKA